MAHRAHPIRVVLLLTALAVLMLFALPADAASTNASLSIGQTFNILNNSSGGIDTTGTYTLTAIDGAPMPGGTHGGSVSISLTGDQEKTFRLYAGSVSADSSSIVFSHAGVYQYTVESTTAQKNQWYKLDQNRYTVRIYVANTGNGGLSITWIACVDSNNKKSGDIIYHHTYNGPTQDNVSPKPDQPNQPDQNNDNKKDNQNVTPGGTTPSKGNTTITKTKNAAQNASQPKTGDTFPIIAWTGVLSGAAVALLIVVLLRRRRDQK